MGAHKVVNRVLRNLTIAGAVLILSCNQFAFAHEIDIHRQITVAAVDYLASKDVRFQSPSVKQKIKDLLLNGTIHEDDGFALYPLGRYYFHFSPALDDGPTGSHSKATCSSSDWGVPLKSSCQATETGTVPLYYYAQNQISLSNVANQFTWAVALSKKSSVEGWTALGYLVHLLEDLSSPAHTRNDRHPHKDSTTFPDADPVEYHTLQLFQQNAITLPLTPDGPLLPASTFDELANALQAWTSSNFYSTDTTDDAGPTATAGAATEKYFSGPCLSSTASPYITFPCTNGKRKLATKSVVSVNAGITYSQSLTNGWISDELAEEQIGELLPTSVKYVASLIKLYADQGAIIPTYPTGSLSITSKLDGVPWAGSFSWDLYGLSSIPYGVANGTLPFTKSDAPIGQYLLSYLGGGPPNSTFVGFSPCTSIPLSAFTCQAALSTNGSLEFAFLFKSNPNQRPNAGFLISSGVRSATESQTLPLKVPSGGFVSVSFDGSRSNDPDNDQLTYEWRSNGIRIPNSAFTNGSFSFNFGSGTHAVRLIVTDSHGASSSPVQATIQVTAVPSNPLFTIRDIGTILGTESQATSINNSGQVAGWYRANNGLQRAFFWDGTTAQDIGDLGNGQSGWAAIGSGINEAGHIAGYAISPVGVQRPFFWNRSTMLDIGDLGGPSAQGVSVNDLDQVVGTSSTSDPFVRYPFVWSNSPNTNLPYAEASLTTSSSGVIPGFSVQCQGTDASAYLIYGVYAFANALSPGVVSRTPCIAGVATFAPFNLNSYLDARFGPYPTWLTSVLFPLKLFVKNTTGLPTVSGDYTIPVNLFGAFNGFNSKAYEPSDTTWPTIIGGPQFIYNGNQWTNYAHGGTMLQILTQNARQGFGNGINNAGQLTGMSEVFTPVTFRFENHAFLWSGGIPQDLGTFGALTSIGTAINDLAHVAGSFYGSVSGLIPSHAFLWDGSMRDIGSLFGNSVGLAINNIDQIVGSSDGGAFNPTTHAFFWDGLKMWDLNTQLVSGSGWTEITSATGINDAGQITGYGTIGGQTHAFVLTPVTP